MLFLETEMDEKQAIFTFIIHIIFIFFHTKSFHHARVWLIFIGFFCHPFTKSPTDVIDAFTIVTMIVIIDVANSTLFNIIAVVGVGVDVDVLETYLTQIINSFLYGDGDDDGDDFDNDDRIVVIDRAPCLLVTLYMAALWLLCGGTANPVQVRYSSTRAMRYLLLLLTFSLRLGYVGQLR